MVTEEMRKQYARLAVRKGVNVQKGQQMLIKANARDYEFVRLCVQEAYDAGAARVTIEYRDEIADRMNYLNEPKELLCEVPQWFYDREKYRQDRTTCKLHIVSDTPGLLKDIPAKTLQAVSLSYAEKMKDLQYYYMNNRAQWCVIALPGTDWAKLMFPDAEEGAAYKMLEEAIYEAGRVRAGEDALSAWDAHQNRLSLHADELNAQCFSALHFRSKETGTDLTVGLVEDHVWVGGGGEDAQGVFFCPNIPTEEVFTMPSRTRVDGIVYATRPLNYNGKLIEDFWIRFENGKATDCDAKKEAELLRELLDFDEGSRHLGEVALVPYDSPISKSGLLFYETLFDENAACHLALGRPYPENLKGGSGMTVEELMAHDANDSMQHEDFMIGTADLDVDGIRGDGTRVPVFRNGAFV